MAGPDDGNGDEPCVELWTQITGEVGKHAVEQFMGVGRFGFGFVGRLPEAGARLIEFVATGAVV